MKNSIAVAAFLLVFFSSPALCDEPYDLIIENGLIVTMDPEKRLIENGFVAIKDGAIAKIGDSTQRDRLRATQTIDAKGKAVLPGLVNTHTHVPMVLFRGFADDLELHEWLYEHIFPAEARFVTADFVAAGSRLALVEMIRGGTTTFHDMYFFEEETARAAKEAGVRAVLSVALLDFPTPEHQSWDEGFQAFLDFADRWENDALITPSIGPHSAYTVSPEHLKQAAEAARERRLPYHIHVAETVTEMDQIKKDFGLSPVQHLDNLGVLGDNVIAAHGVHLDEADQRTLAERSVGVAHCPQSNMKLCSGAAPVPSLLQADVAVGLGTDGAASNNDLDMWGEMDTAAKLHKLITNRPTTLPAAQVLEMATLGGARVLGMEKTIGSIEEGKRADLITVDLEGAHLVPLYNIYSHLVYAAKPGDVSDVVVEGRPLMLERKLRTLDEKAILVEADSFRRQIEAGRDSTPEAPTL